MLLSILVTVLFSIFVKLPSLFVKLDLLVMCNNVRLNLSINKINKIPIS